MAGKSDKLNFEKALEKLERIVADMEKGELSLDEMLKKFQEGMELARLCNEHLDMAEKKVEIITGNKDGKRIIQSFEGVQSGEDGE